MIAVTILLLISFWVPLPAQSPAPEPDPGAGSETAAPIAPVPALEGESSIAPRFPTSELEGHGFQWKNAVLESFFFLSVMHGFRMAGKKHERKHLRMAFKSADKNGDGALDKAEAEAGMPKVAEHFATIDADQDGKVTHEELRAHKRR